MISRAIDQDGVAGDEIRRMGFSACVRGHRDYIDVLCFVRDELRSRVSMIHAATDAV
jgi:hypothetical protein